MNDSVEVIAAGESMGLAFAMQLIQAEESRTKNILHMTANENVLSETAASLLSSPLKNRYLLSSTLKDVSSVKPALFSNQLGDVGRLESVVEAQLNVMLAGVKTDFRPLSGVHAMICAIASLTKPGDIVLSLNPDHGGHFATQNLVAMMGRESRLLDFDPVRMTPCLERLERIAGECSIKLLFLDDGLPLYPMPFRRIRQIVGPQVIISYDASHSLGLIVGMARPNPIVEGCDIIQANTHKTFPGPHKAIIHFADMRLAKAVMNKIDTGLVSTQHTHHLLALYITVMEMCEFGESYASAIVENTNCFSEALERNGFTLMQNPEARNQSHQVLFYAPDGMCNHEASARLLRFNISTNAKTIFGRDIVRVGLQEVTRLGMGTREVCDLADIYRDILMINEPCSSLAARLALLRDRFRKVHYSFD